MMKGANIMSSGIQIRAHWDTATGVRPSPGAAGHDVPSALQVFDAGLFSEPAAPGDGRTPPQPRRVRGVSISALRIPGDQSPRSAGFTLLELLIALAIFSMVLVAINGVFYSAMRLQARGSQSVEDALPLQHAVSILKRDLQGIVAPGGTLGGSLQSGTSSSIPGNTIIPAGATTFYTATGIIDTASPWPDVQKVVYFLKAPDRRTDVGKDLVRVVSRNLLPVAQEEFVEQWLMGGVERLQLAFYDGSMWRDSWDSTTPDAATGQTNNLPRAIKVQLDLAVAYGEPQKAPVQIIVPVVVQARTNATQSAGG